jgi:hypothetical protein
LTVCLAQQNLRSGAVSRDCSGTGLGVKEHSNDIGVPFSRCEGEDRPPLAVAFTAARASSNRLTTLVRPLVVVPKLRSIAETSAKLTWIDGGGSLRWFISDRYDEGGLGDPKESNSAHGQQHTLSASPPAGEDERQRTDDSRRHKVQQDHGGTFLSSLVLEAGAQAWVRRIARPLRRVIRDSPKSAPQVFWAATAMSTLSAIDTPFR